MPIDRSRIVPPLGGRHRPTANRLIRVMALEPPDIKVVGCSRLDLHGFSITTNRRVVVGTRARFEFRLTDTLLVTAPAVAVGSETVGRGRSRHVSTWTFREGRDIDQAVRVLVISIMTGAPH